MFGFESFDIGLSFSPFYFILFLVLLSLYALYVYKYTVPVISTSKKILLVSLRIFALLLLLFVFFEPVLTLTKKEVLEPKNLIFVDNSRSIQIEDGTQREELVRSFLSEAKGLNLDSELYSFGNDVNQVDIDSINAFNFIEGSTDFSEIFARIKEYSNNISSAVIVSDGVITEGTNPLYTAERLNFPVFTVGIGDTTKRKDIELRNIQYNEYIYAETPTTIQATILNDGFPDQVVNVSLFEDNNLLERKNISLSEDGIQNVNFEYTPDSGGEKKLTVSVSNLEDEFTAANNKKVFYINVLSNKINVLLIAGAPSPDLSFIKNTLKEDENLTVNSIIQIGQDRYIENKNKEILLDSAQIIFLIGFPSGETSTDFLNSVRDELLSESKPFYVIITSGTDFTKLNSLNQVLPFTFSNPSQKSLEVQPDIPINEERNPLLQNNAQNPVNAWNNLPPVYQPGGDYKPKPESEIISTVKINNTPINTPLILTRRLGSKRSIAVLAEDIWKWKLQSANKNLNLFDNFFHNSIKWLNTSEKQKQVSVKAIKRNFSTGEDIEFAGQIYDQTFNPVSDAEVSVEVTGGNENYRFNLSSVGNGLYEGSVQINKTGDYIYEGTAIRSGEKLGSDSGRFNIGEVDIEMVNPRMNYEFLNLLANETGGEFFIASDFEQLFEILNELNRNTAEERIITSEIRLWSDEWLMVIVIILFALEWFFRKRAGML